MDARLKQEAGAKRKKRDRPGVLALKATVFVNGAVPLGLLIWDGAHERLGVNPIEFITRTTGTLTLVFLLATLAVSTLRRAGLPPVIIKVRRMLGLYAFFYGFLHFMTYVWLDQFFHLDAIARDALLGRPFITVGLIAFFLMIPQAVTSTDAWVKKLGGKRWKQIHNRVYAVVLLGVIHETMIVKVVTTRQYLFWMVVLVLLGERFVHAARGKARAGLSEREPT